MRRRFEAILAIIMITLSIALIYYQFVKHAHPEGDLTPSSKVVYQYDGIPEDMEAEIEDE